jgi:hypothetical protein
MARAQNLSVTARDIIDLASVASGSGQRRAHLRQRVGRGGGRLDLCVEPRSDSKLLRHPVRAVIGTGSALARSGGSIPALRVWKIVSAISPKTSSCSCWDASLPTRTGADFSYPGVGCVAGAGVTGAADGVAAKGFTFAGVAGSPRIGRTSIERRSRSCTSHQSASCSENSAIRPEVSGQTLRTMQAIGDGAR